MKKLLLVLVFMMVVGLMAQDQGMNLSITAQSNDGNATALKSEVHKKAILANLKALEENYLSQLPKRQYLEASMLVEEIREILLGKEDIKTEANVDISAQTTTETSQSVNINMNITGFDNPSSVPEPQETTPQAEVNEPPAAIVSAKEAMNSGAFQQLMSNISDEAFAEDQLRYVRTAANSHYFTVNQTEQLIDLFTFAEEKLDCLRIVYPKVIDQENSFTIISHFTFEEDKRSAEQIINQ